MCVHVQIIIIVIIRIPYGRGGPNSMGFFRHVRRLCVCVYFFEEIGYRLFTRTIYYIPRWVKANCSKANQGLPRVPTTTIMLPEGSERFFFHSVPSLPPPRGHE